MSLENSVLEEKLTMEIMKVRLMNEEARRKDLNSSSNDIGAYVVEKPG